MSTPFYEIADRLDQFKKYENIDSGKISELIKYLNEMEFSRYFFLDLDNPAWITPLYKIGFFSKIPPPIEAPNNPGYFSMPLWPGGEYLKSMADKYPDIVKDVALSLITENSRAIRTMLEALLKIPVNYTAETVGKFKDWVLTPYANFMMLSQEIGNIMGYLTKGGQIDAALKVLEVLLEPFPSKDSIDETKRIAGTKNDFYLLDQAIKTNLPMLTEVAPISVVGIAEKQLFKAIELEYDPKIDDDDKKLKSYWRLSINPQSDENYERDLKNLLVNIIINALNKACEQKKDQAPQIIIQYLDGGYSIFRRISVFLLRTWGMQYPDLLKEAYVNYRKEPIIGGQSEFYRFLEIQFNNLPAFAKKEIVEERKNPDPKWIDSLLQQHPESFNGETIEEKRHTLIEKRQLVDLAPIASYLEGKEKKYYKILLKKYGQPSPRPEEGVVVTSWEGPESPIELNELAKKPIADIIQYLLDYVPVEQNTFGVPSREGLGRILETDVQTRASEYANKANLFLNKDLPFVYHVHFFRGLEGAVKNQEKLGLADVIILCEFIAGQNKDKFQKQEYEPGLPSAKLALLQLLEELFKVKEPYIEDDLLEKCGQIIVKLLHDAEPFPDDERATNYDPATHSLNCLHGVAMHSIVAYGLYCDRKRKNETGNNGTPVMITLLKDTLTEKLDKTKDPSLAVHSVFGWYFPQFIYLDKKWALENRDGIFPTQGEMAKYWQAAWSAYIRFSDVYTNVFPELLKQYQKALDELSISLKKQDPDKLDGKMATHILKAYLLDMIKLDSGDGLMNLYYQKTDDETRSIGNFWLSKFLESQKPSSQDVFWKKIWSLWQWRIKEATSSAESNNYLKEISSFCRLLINVPIDLSEIHSIIGQTLKFKPGGFEIDEIIKYLGKYCENYPSLAISLLHEIVLSNQISYILDDAKAAIERILTFAMTDNNDSKAKAIETINIFGERGDYSWRPLLNKARE